MNIFSPKRAKPSRDGDAKPRDSRSQPGCRGHLIPLATIAVRAGFLFLGLARAEMVRPGIKEEIQKPDRVEKDEKQIKRKGNSEMFSKTFQMIKSDEEGQALVEYGLILFLVSVAIVAVLGLLTGQLQVVFQQVIAALGG